MNVPKTKAGTVLIVDDTPDYLDLLALELSAYGFHVLAASNGANAIGEAEQAQPDIILLDVMMPDIDGYDICRRLKQKKVTKDIPVIFMTALFDVDSKVKGFDVGAVDYVTKPLNCREVVARITSHLMIRGLHKNLTQEVTEYKKIGEKLRESVSDLRARNSDLDKFNHTVAHDLKDPLGTIILGAEVLREEHTSMSADELEFHLSLLSRNGKKATKIINELLSLAKVQKDEIEKEPLDMQAIVLEAWDRLGNAAKEKQAEIILPNEWPVAQGYAPWIEEVWVNYLSNALKYGGHPPCVKLGASVPQNGMIRFWVKDNGPGISPAEQSQIFTPFTRLNQNVANGDGLGLSIVRHIVEKLDGSVAVESDGIIGKGSMFSFTLPVA